MTYAADRIRTRRQAFATPGSMLDRVLRVLSVTLPALIGVMAALMLITPLGPRGEVSFLLDRNKVAIAGDRLRVDNAMYRGSDSEGRPFSLLAGEAVQSSNSQPLVELRELAARIALSEGPAVLSADTGVYDIEDEELRIPGLLEFSAADGYRMAARNVLINLGTHIVTSDGRVTGAVPGGTFSADSIFADLDRRVIALDGNARMQMIPGELRMPTGFEP